MDLYRADPCTISYIQTIHWRGNCFLSRSSLLVSKTISTQLLMRIRTTTITNRVTNTPATFQSFSHSVPDYFKVVHINVHTYSLWFSPWKRGSMTEPEKKADHGTSTTDRCYGQFSIRGWNFDKLVWKSRENGTLPPLFGVVFLLRRYIWRLLGSGLRLSRVGKGTARAHFLNSGYYSCKHKSSLGALWLRGSKLRDEIHKKAKW